MRSKLVAIAVVSTLALVACEQVLGLDHFAKCDSLGCDSGIDDGGGLESSAVDSGPDAFELPDGVSEASSWANWTMPNTPSEVEAGAWDASLRAFDASVPGYLTDEVTHLTWSLSIGSASSIESAVAYCTQQNGARLPTRIELASLLDSTRATSGLAPELDPALTDAGSNANLLWTSSYYRPVTNNTLQFWFVDSTSGDMKFLTARPGGVLCVR